MCLASNNELVQRAALEAMSNLVNHDQILERFVAKDSQDLRIFVSFCGSDDVKTQSAPLPALP
eukprot:2147886-Prymnesium_polylepis.1